MRYPGRARRVPEWQQDKRPYKRGAKWEARPGEQSDGRVVPEAQRKLRDPEEGQRSELGKAAGKGG